MTGQQLVLPKSYVDLRAARPRNDAPFNIGACSWTIHEGNTRFQTGARPELAGMTPTKRIAIFGKVNEALARKAEILDKAGIPVQGITGVEGHYPNEIHPDNFQETVEALQAAGMVQSMVTANLFYDPRYGRGALSTIDPDVRAMAIEWAMRTVDIGYEFQKVFNHLPTDVFWPGGEGAHCGFEVDIPLGLHLYADSMNQIMAYELGKGGKMLFAGESKPNEPVDRIILPTTADFLALMPALLKPEFWARFGVNPETAHEKLANLSATSPVALALALGKLYHYHANWQKRLAWDQDYGVEINAEMLEVVHYMKELGFNGYIGLDMQARPTSKDVTKVMEYSVTNLRILEAIEKTVDWNFVDQLRDERTPEKVEQYVNMCILTALSGIDPKAMV